MDTETRSVSGRIIDADPTTNSVRLENPQRDMRMWFELATEVDLSDASLWTRAHDFDVIGAGND